MAGVAGADLGVRRRLGGAAGVAGRRVGHAFDVLEDGLNAPEAAAREDDRLLARFAGARQVDRRGRELDGIVGAGAARLQKKPAPRTAAAAAVVPSARISLRGLEVMVRLPGSLRSRGATVTVGERRSAEVEVVGQPRLEASAVAVHQERRQPAQRARARRRVRQARRGRRDGGRHVGRVVRAGIGGARLEQTEARRQPAQQPPVVGGEHRQARAAGRARRDVAEPRGVVDGRRDPAQLVDQPQVLRLRAGPDVPAPELVDARAREAAGGAPVGDGGQEQLVEVADLLRGISALLVGPRAVGRHVVGVRRRGGRSRRRRRPRPAASARRPCSRRSQSSR